MKTIIKYEVYGIVVNNENVNEPLFVFEKVFNSHEEAERFILLGMSIYCENIIRKVYKKDFNEQ